MTGAASRRRGDDVADTWLGRAIRDACADAARHHADSTYDDKDDDA